MSYPIPHHATATSTTIPTFTLRPPSELLHHPSPLTATHIVVLVINSTICAALALYIRNLWQRKDKFYVEEECEDEDVLRNQSTDMHREGTDNALPAAPTEVMHPPAMHPRSAFEIQRPISYELPAREPVPLPHRPVAEAIHNTAHTPSDRILPWQHTHPPDGNRLSTYTLSTFRTSHAPSLTPKRISRLDWGDAKSVVGSDVSALDSDVDDDMIPDRHLSY